MEMKFFCVGKIACRKLARSLCLYVKCISTLRSADTILWFSGCCSFFAFATTSLNVALSDWWAFFLFKHLVSPLAEDRLCRRLTIYRRSFYLKIQRQCKMALTFRKWAFIVVVELHSWSANGLWWSASHLAKPKINQFEKKAIVYAA